MITYVESERIEEEPVVGYSKIDILRYVEIFLYNDLF
jgi:hypothetical protein